MRFVVQILHVTLISSFLSRFRAKSGLFAASQLNVQIEEKSRAVSTLKSQSKLFFPYFTCSLASALRDDIISA